MSHSTTSSANFDIFKDLRKVFQSFWNATFLDGIEAALHDPKFPPPDGDEVSKIALELRKTIALATEKDTFDLGEMVQKFEKVSETLQKNKISTKGTFPKASNEIMYLLLQDMFNIEVRGRNEKYKVQWYGHLFHHLKLLDVPTSNIYRTLLRMMETYWERLVKPSYNVERRYLHKLMGFVSQIDGIKHRKLDDDNSSAEFAEFHRALTLYQKATNWNDEKVKEYLLEEVNKSLKHLQTIECEAASINQWGGRLINNGCEMVIPEGAVKEEVDFQIDVTAKEPQLPEEYIPISSTMICEPKIFLYEEAKIVLPTFCFTEDEDVEAIMFTQLDESNADWKPTYREPLKNLVHHSRFGFRTKFVSKFVVAIKKIFSCRTTYSLRLEIWYSLHGNFSCVSFVDDKSVKNLWQTEMREDGYERTQARINPISVKGKDPIAVELQVNGSDVVAFKTCLSKSFTVEDNIAKRGQSHHANFCLTTLPVGTEKLRLGCVVILKEKPVETEEWNLVWPLFPEKSIEDVFREEIIPSFKSDDVWKKFSRNGLGLTDREVNRGVGYDSNDKESKMKALLLWKQKMMATEKTQSERREEDLIAQIRQLAIKQRESPAK